MNTAERNRLSKEAEMQLAGIKKDQSLENDRACDIDHWRGRRLRRLRGSDPSHVSRCPWHSFHYCRVGRRGCF